MGEYTDIGSLSTDIPKGTDQLSQADDHMRGIKTALKNTFPNALGVVNASADELNAMVDYAYGDLNVEDRFVVIEERTNNKSVQQFNMLNDLGVGATVEKRFSDATNGVETKLLNVTQAEIDGLQGYDTANGYIEPRLVNLGLAVDQIFGNPLPPPYVSLLWCYEQVLNIGAWQSERAGKASNDELEAIASYNGCDLPLQYSSRDLGFDMQLVASKIEQLEYLAGYGTVPGTIVWKQLIANLDGGDGGINVAVSTDSEGTWGFVMKGLIEGSKIDFRFYDAVINDWGDWARNINSGAKQCLVDASLEVNANIRIGDGLFGPGDAPLVADNWGHVEVEGQIVGANGQPETVSHKIYCVFY